MYNDESVGLRGCESVLKYTTLRGSFCDDVRVLESTMLRCSQFVMRSDTAMLSLVRNHMINTQHKFRARYSNLYPWDVPAKMRDAPYLS